MTIFRYKTWDRKDEDDNNSLIDEWHKYDYERLIISTHYCLWSPSSQNNGV